MKSTRYRIVTLVAAATVSATLLTGCGSGGGSSSAGAAVTAWSASAESETYFPDSFTTWNSANPKSAIDVQYFASSAYNEKIRSAVGAGNGPDLIYSWAGATLGDYVANNQVADLSAGTKDVLSRLAPSVVAAGEVNGKVYAVPNNQSQPVLLYFNTKLFTDAGLEPPKTWDDLLNAVATFNAKGIAPFALAGQSQWPELMWLEYLVERIGGPQVFDNIVAGKPDAWSQPAVTEALEKLQQLVNAGAFIKGFSSVAADANADLALLQTGKAAMLLQGSWSYATFKQQNPDFVAGGGLGYTTFPTVPGGAGDPSDIVGNPSNYWSVSASAPGNAATIATNYLNSTVFSDDYVKTMIANGSVPPILGIDDQLAASKDAPFLKLAYGMVTQSKNFQLSWDLALPADASQVLLTNLSAIFTGQSSPQQFESALNATIK